MPGPKNPRMITAQGKTQTITKWAMDLGCNKMSIYGRLYRGMSDEAAVTPPFPINGIAGHSMRRSPEMAVWRSMRNRCKDMDDPRYGGRGIRVCSRWIDSFDAFYEDLGQRPDGEYSIDRINNDGNYACGKCEDCHASGVFICNCRWATRDIQGRNRHNIRFIECDGESRALLDWARITGIDAETIWRRVTSYGWGAKEALTTPCLLDGKASAPKNTKISCNGKSLSVQQWADELGLKYNTVRARVERCETEEELQRVLYAPLRGTVKGELSERTRSVVENGGSERQEAMLEERNPPDHDYEGV